MASMSSSRPTADAVCEYERNAENAESDDDRRENEGLRDWIGE